MSLALTYIVYKIGTVPIFPIGKICIVNADAGGSWVVWLIAAP